MSDSGSKTRVEAFMEEARSGRGAGELIDARLRISRLRFGWGKLVGVFAREPAGVGGKISAGRPVFFCNRGFTGRSYDGYRDAPFSIVVQHPTLCGAIGRDELLLYPGYFRLSAFRECGGADDQNGIFAATRPIPFPSPLNWVGGCKRTDRSYRPRWQPIYSFSHRGNNRIVRPILADRE